MTDTFGDVVIETNTATHALIVQQEATTGANKTALNLSSADVDSSAVWITGHEKQHGTVKIGHVKPTGISDGNAAALSIYNSGIGTAAQGIFIDSDASTGKIINARKSGVEVFVVDQTGIITCKAVRPKNGFTGSFKSYDRKTVTVTNGIITSIT